MQGLQRFWCGVVGFQGWTGCFGCIWCILRSQIVTSSYGGRRYDIFAFTEQGVAMLSSVLRSDRAIQVNIQIMRIFTKLRHMLLTQKELQEKIENLESKYDEHFRVVFDAIRQLIQDDGEEKEEIGFKVG